MPISVSALPLTATISAYSTISDPITVGTMTASGDTISGSQGSSFSGEVAQFTDVQSGYSASDYAASIDFGDGNTADGTISLLSYDSDTGISTYSVTGSDTFAVAGQLSPTVTISGPNGQSATATGTANVAGIVVSGGEIAATQNESFSGPVATFSDNGPGVSGDGYTYSIDWGDGSSASTGTVSGECVEGVWTIDETHTYTLAGEFMPIVTVTDSSDDRASSGVADAQVAGISVNEDDLSLTSGDATTGLLADFTDTAGDAASATAANFTASINWGSGSSVAGTIAPDGNGGFDVFYTGSHAYSGAGIFNPTVTITTDLDSDSASVTDVVDATAVSALTTGNQTLSETQYQPFGGVLAQYTDSTSGASLADESATIDWGDGTSSQGIVLATPISGSSFADAVEGEHVYDQPGIFNPVVTINDAGGDSAEVTSEVDVSGLTASGIAIAPTVNESFSGTVATFTDDISGDTSEGIVAVIDWGDGNVSDGTVTEEGDSSTYDISGSDTYAAAGTDDVSVVVYTNYNSFSVAATSTATVTGIVQRQQHRHQSHPGPELQRRGGDFHRPAPRSFHQRLFSEHRMGGRLHRF